LSVNQAPRVNGIVGAPGFDVDRDVLHTTSDTHQLSENVLLAFFNRPYQDLECIMPHDQSPSVGGAYAKLRGGHPAGWEFTGDDGVNCARIHGAAAPFRARVGGLSEGPYH
jgi:hypothetical protein